MDRYFVPEIFTHTLDGLDLSNHIVATYYMKDRLERWPRSSTRTR